MRPPTGPHRRRRGTADSDKLAVHPDFSEKAVECCATGPIFPGHTNDQLVTIANDHPTGATERAALPFAGNDIGTALADMTADGGDLGTIELLADGEGGGVPRLKRSSLEGTCTDPDYDGLAIRPVTVQVVLRPGGSADTPRSPVEAVLPLLPALPFPVCGVPLPFPILGVLLGLSGMRLGRQGGQRRRYRAFE